MSVLNYLHFLKTLGKSYSVLNTHRSMLLQTLKLLGNSWCDNTVLIPRFMKGLYNEIPPLPRYNFSWDVSVLINYLKSIFPLENLDLKALTLKVVALVSLAIAPRAQTLVALNLDDMSVYESKVKFSVTKVLKTSKPGKTVQIEVPHFKEEILCPMHTLLFYLQKTKGIRKCRQVFISYVSYKSVCTKTVARWLKEVLSNSGIDTGVFKAHSFRGAAASAAFNRGCSLQQILKTGDWSSVKNFKKFYLYPESHTSNSQGSFVNAVLS